MFVRASVGERSHSIEALAVRRRGVVGSENAGISSDNDGENPSRRKSEVSYATLIGVG